MKKPTFPFALEQEVFTSKPHPTPPAANAAGQGQLRKELTRPLLAYREGGSPCNARTSFEVKPNTHSPPEPCPSGRGPGCTHCRRYEEAAALRRVVGLVLFN
ncbi:unnamed protein product [Boreogadus saida]